MKQTAQRLAWLLYRIDDNGNEIEMARFAERSSAERAMHDYERRGHKQVYLVRSVRLDEQRRSPPPQS
ncbi:hypothetical protein [Stutzerimonas balearica]|uniref:hypothetical protein n=1 Tax=Stutzerimonas balearica TaxID=74829 RepID=UPI0022B06BDA|nr:hypothetical protein [Stutzerimonas balearica]MCZ4128699.1 hypothetical protein [Stutzerimonas balearica]